IIKALDSLLTRFPRERQWLLPALHAVQHARGWLADDALIQVAAHLRIPPSEGYGVATHYPELRRAPRGRHHVRGCSGVSCAFLGGREVLAEVSKRFGIAPGESGAEHEITLEAADCFFACSVAPIIEVDGDYHGRVTAAQVPELPAWFRHGRHHGSPPAPPLLESSTPLVAASARTALSDLAVLARGRRGHGLRVLVQPGPCGLAAGADPLLEPLRAGIRERFLDAELIEGACSGMCYAAPLIEVVTPESTRFVIERLEPERVPAVLDAL